MSQPAISYRILDPAQVIDTIKSLSARIEERFPDSGLWKLAGELLDLALQTKERMRFISSPILGVRIVNYLLIVLIASGLLGSFYALEISLSDLHFFQFVQVLEAAINDVVLIAAGIFFLMTIETRIKRRRALKALHELRSIAHIIDMLQLTKDPENTLKRGPNTKSSPEKLMDTFHLSRYLDYCSEMLSLTGKIAALYVQNFDDGVALEAVNEIESLTNGLSRKIWQKLIILHSYS